MNEKRTYEQLEENYEAALNLLRLTDAEIERLTAMNAQLTADLLQYGGKKIERLEGALEYIAEDACSGTEPWSAKIAREALDKEGA